MGIWNDRMIAEWAKTCVSPYNESHVNPASIDLGWSGRARMAIPLGGFSNVTDMDELTMFPGGFYLLDTMEYVVMPEDAVGKLFLKSSAGRMGIEHLHAGYIDPGFEGTITLELEVRVPWSVTIKRGQRLVQLTLEAMAERPFVSYKVKGRYSKQNSPTESKGLP